MPKLRNPAAETQRLKLSHVLQVWEPRQSCPHSQPPGRLAACRALRSARCRSWTPTSAQMMMVRCDWLLICRIASWTALAGHRQGHWCPAPHRNSCDWCPYAGEGTLGDWLPQSVTEWAHWAYDNPSTLVYYGFGAATVGATLVFFMGGRRRR